MFPNGCVFDLATLRHCVHLLKMRFLVLLSLVLSSCLRAAPRPDHVIVVSIDGGKPAVIRDSEMPVLKQLAAEGAVTWDAQTIFPPKTLPSHTSMLTGVGPEKHTVLWNDYLPIRGSVKSPTIFALARRQDPALSAAMFVGKMKFRHLWQTGSVDQFNLGGPMADRPVPLGQWGASSTSQTIAGEAAAYLRDHKPRLCFIHFPDPDKAGHASGWGSPEQKEAFKVTDQALGQIIIALEEAGIAEKSVVILSADHGGHDKTHFDRIPEDMTIPWLVWGEGVRSGHTIARPVTTFDTAATALWLLGIPIPEDFDGMPVEEAFD
jgi:predicted AlkP superfamily pyrophosphatase or phosphodiesterase